MTRDPRNPRDPRLPELDDEPGPMPPLSAAESDALAWAAVSRWAALPPGLDPIDDYAGPAKPLDRSIAEQLARQAVRAHERRRAARKLQPWAARAAAALLCLGGALGVVFAANRLWPDEPANTKQQPQATLPHPAAESGTTAPAPPNEPAPAPTVASAPAREATAEDKARPSPAPEPLLAQANALRAQRRWTAAERTYRQVANAGASKEQRYVALVAGAAIALQHLNKPARALAAYQSALALIPAGNLDEEALYGIAECHRALADPTAERAALQRLTAAHPNGMFTAAAKQRAAALEAASSP
jgi:tetratricopeptide (TPR) repeat protein